MTRISLAETRLEGAPAVRTWRRQGARSRTATRVCSCEVLRGRARSWTGTLLSALVLGTLFPVLGQAAPRDVTIRWNPSPSEGAMSYLLSVGTSSQSYTSQVLLSSPEISGDVWSKTVQLEGSVDQYLALRAVDDESGKYSAYSNEIVVAAEGGDPGPGEPNFGVTSLQGIPAVASGLISVEALADGNTESVEFKLNDVVFRIDNTAPYSFNGDNGPGALIGWDTTTVADGFHTISATGYSEDGGGGEMGRAASVTFEVHNEPVPEPLGVPGKPVLVVD